MDFVEMDLVEIETFISKIFDSVIYIEKDEMIIFRNNKEVFYMYHQQDCCEDICGDLSDLVGTPIIEARQSENEGSVDENESFTWTFYTLRTIKDTVDLRWYGTSNGYYSEDISITKEVLL